MYHSSPGRYVSHQTSHELVFQGGSTTDRIHYLVGVQGTATDTSTDAEDQTVVRGQDVEWLGDGFAIISGFVGGFSDTYQIEGEVVHIEIGQGPVSVIYDGQDVTSNPQSIVEPVTGDEALDVCVLDIQAALDVSAQQSGCEPREQLMQCPDGSSLVYRASNDCEVDALRERGWTGVSGGSIGSGDVGVALLGALAGAAAGAFFLGRD